LQWSKCSSGYRTGEHTSDIGIYDGGICIEGKHENGPRCVGTYSRQGKELREIIWHFSFVTINNDPSCLVKPQRTSVISETDPHSHELCEGRVGARLWRRKLLDEFLISRDDAGSLRLGQHHL
jgi:hypothetical protein